jgi:GntR family transcriptional regulator, N-acetylglucosamine utilization regulator
MIRTISGRSFKETWALQCTGPGPLYRQLAEGLQSLIDENALPPGAALPSEREMAEELALARITVRAAYKELMTRGCLEIRQGSGTFVANRVKRIEQPLWRLSSFSEDMRSRGMVPDARLIGRSVSSPSPNEVFILGLEQSEKVVRIDRLRLSDGVPMAIERAVVPEKFLGKEFRGKGSLYAALERRGFRPHRATQRLTAVVLGESEARMLGVEPGASSLQIERVSRLSDQRVVEYTQSQYRGDAYDFVAELNSGDN